MNTYEIYYVNTCKILYKYIYKTSRKLQNTYKNIPQYSSKYNHPKNRHKYIKNIVKYTNVFS